MKEYEIVELTNQDKKLWDKVSEYARKCSWQTTGEYLSDLMRINDFLEWERVFAVSIQEKIVGFCAFTKSSSVLGEKYSPYIGFLFVEEEYRGNDLDKKLCFAVIRYARSIGFDRVYLYSDIKNYYERIGFQKIAEEDTPWGVRHSVYTYLLN